MKKRNQQIGHHWFSKDTMEYFGTVIVSPPNVENIFITSDYSGFDRTDRAYTLRWFNTETNCVETLGEFLQYKSLSEARIARKEFTKSKRLLGIAT